MAVTATLSEPNVNLTNVEPNIDSVTVDRDGIARVVVGATLLGCRSIEALDGLGDQLIHTAGDTALRRIAADDLAALDSAEGARMASEVLQGLSGLVGLVLLLGAVVVYLRGSKDKGSIETLEGNNAALTERWQSFHAVAISPPVTAAIRPPARAGATENNQVEDPDRPVVTPARRTSRTADPAHRDQPIADGGSGLNRSPDWHAHRTARPFFSGSCDASVGALRVWNVSTPFPV